MEKGWSHYVMLTAIASSAVIGWYYAIPIVVAALRTGRLLARGVVYDRDRQPVRFWSGIVFWVFVMSFSTLATAFLIYW